MRARIEVRLQLPRAAIHDENGLGANLVLVKVSGIRNLLESARHLPDAREEPLVLKGKEFRIDVASLGDDSVPNTPTLGGPRRGVFHDRVLCRFCHFVKCLDLNRQDTCLIDFNLIALEA